MRPDGAGTSEERSPAEGRGDRIALVVFVLEVVVAVALIRYFNRDQWFRYDEWEVLLKREMSQPSSLLHSWNGHPVTVTTVLYKVLYAIVGLHHYWPYQFLTIAGHVGVAVALRVLLRRMRIDPWVANAAIGVLLVYGAAQDDLAWGFQVVYTAPLALGLAQMLLLDHDGRTDRRDAWALLAGAVAVWTGPPGPLIVVFAAAVAWARRGPRPALLQASVLVPFAAWLVLAPEPETPVTPIATPGVALHYAGRVVLHAARGFGRFPVLTLAFGAATLVGAGMIASTLLRPGWRTRAVAPLATSAAAVGMAALIGFTRAAPTTLSPVPPVAPRYLYLVVALALPALCVALDRVARTSLPATIAVVLALLVPLPRQIDSLGPPASFATTGFEIGTEVWGQVADEIPVQGDLQPYPLFSPGLLASELAAAHRTGKLPDPPPGLAAERSAAKLALALDPIEVADLRDCRRMPKGRPVRLPVDAGIHILVPGASLDEIVGGRPVGTIELPPASARRVLWPLVVQRSATTPDARIDICR